MKRGCGAVWKKSIDAKGIMYTTDALLDGDCFPFVLAQAKPNCGVEIL
jgi:hypothetical protein